VRGLDGKVAIVTGGATSIGAAIARAFRVAGTKVMIADIAESAGKALVAELGKGARFHHCDITDDRDIAACVAATVHAFGGIDFLVNNGCNYVDRRLASSRADRVASLNVNVVSGAIFVREAIPHLRERGGVIVNFSTVAGKHGQRGRALYPASKAANLQVTRNEAMELAPFKIRVNAVAPGWT